MFSSDNKIA